MLKQRTNPVGVDVVVQRIQKAVYDYLTTNSSWTDYESYPRCYKNPSKENNLPEHYENGEYKEVLFDDNFNVTSYILVEDNSDIQNSQFNSTQGSMTFQGLLDKLYPDVPHRADEEMNNDILQAFQSAVDAEVNTLVRGIFNVYNNVTLRTRLIEETKFDDMNNYHVIRVDFSFSYYNTCT